MKVLRSAAAHLLRRVTKTAGGIMLSKRAYDQLMSQRARAVSELVKLENVGLDRGISGVVFSKDRALQLYTLLHTYFDFVENPVPLTVVYSASSDAHARAYDELRVDSEHAPVKVTFVRETATFKESVLRVLNQVVTRNIFFLVDDIVFIRPLNLESIKDIDPATTILSFRHSPHLRRSYTARNDQVPPRFSPVGSDPELLQFNWFEQGNEWSDPWSVDGQILSTAEVRVLTRLSDFSAPNSYEGALKTFNDIASNRRGMCYRESRVLNLPINRVQNEVANYSGRVSPEFLLEQWNKGMMLDTGMFGSHIPTSPHEEHPVRFTKRTRLPRAPRQPSSQSGQTDA